VNVIVDRERCVAAGLCELAAPHVFQQDNLDGRVNLIGATTETDDVTAQAIREAVSMCPSGAITLDEK
jgi:ferredoxin